MQRSGREAERAHLRMQHAASVPRTIDWLVALALLPASITRRHGAAADPRHPQGVRPRRGRRRQQRRGGWHRAEDAHQRRHGAWLCVEKQRARTGVIACCKRSAVMRCVSTVAHADAGVGAACRCASWRSRCTTRSTRRSSTTSTERRGADRCRGQAVIGCGRHLQRRSRLCSPAGRLLGALWLPDRRGDCSGGMLAWGTARAAVVWRHTAAHAAAGNATATCATATCASGCAPRHPARYSASKCRSATHLN